MSATGILEPGTAVRIGHPPILDQFIPNPDVRERFETLARAPAPLVMEVARNFDMQSLPLIRLIIRARERILGTSGASPRIPRGIVEETQSQGWGLLVEEPGRLLACGATCQPWLGNVTFTAIPPGDFAAFDEPQQVKIAWTLEVEPLGPHLTRFSNETRAVATDAVARARFRRYWRWSRFGIVAIRLLLLPAVRREAERRWAKR